VAQCVIVDIFLYPVLEVDLVGNNLVLDIELILQLIFTHSFEGLESFDSHLLLSHEDLEDLFSGQLVGACDVLRLGFSLTALLRLSCEFAKVSFLVHLHESFLAGLVIMHLVVRLPENFMRDVEVIVHLLMD